MQTKWYLRSFVILVVLIGLTLEQIAQPNQQIVVEFAGDSISLSNAQNTIAAVTNKLQAIGAKSITYPCSGNLHLCALSLTYTRYQNQTIVNIISI